MTNQPVILVINGDPVRYGDLLAWLRRRRCWLVVLDDLEKARAALQNAKASLAVLCGSFEFCRPFLGLFTELRVQQTAPPLLVLASLSSEAFAVSSLRAGAADYLPSPLDFGEFSQAVSRWARECPAWQAETDLEGGEVLVGGSPVMQALRVQIRRVAASDCNVLITGETGTGKELVAQLIHKNSPRKAHALVCINCAAIPDSLLESELFGYERGAFTGASVASPGKLMAANRGTVFFDEIGDMSPLAQAKILRAIENKEVQRLGTARRYDTDIRILGATHHNLDDLNSAPTFRRDLYFRLNVGRIYLPPLRERKADIAGLAEHMVKDLNKRLGTRVEGITTAAIRCLNQYDWPGNVRELKNVIERVFITLDNPRIGVEDLERVLPSSATNAPAAETPPDSELRLLREALATCSGNKKRAAERLNWSRMTLYRKLAKYGEVVGTASQSGPVPARLGPSVAASSKGRGSAAEPLDRAPVRGRAPAG